MYKNLNKYASLKKYKNKDRARQSDGQYQREDSSEQRHHKGIWSTEPKFMIFMLLYKIQIFGKVFVQQHHLSQSST